MSMEDDDRGTPKSKTHRAEPPEQSSGDVTVHHIRSVPRASTFPSQVPKQPEPASPDRGLNPEPNTAWTAFQADEHHSTAMRRQG